MAWNLAIRLAWLASESTGASFCLSPCCRSEHVLPRLTFFLGSAGGVQFLQFCKGSVGQLNSSPNPLLSELRKSHRSKYLKALFSVGHDGGVNEAHHITPAIAHLLWSKIALGVPPMRCRTSLLKIS